jgi:signal transduction histidine kinase
MQWAVCDQEHRLLIPIADATVLRLIPVLLRATETVCATTAPELAADDHALSRQIAGIFARDPLSFAAVLRCLRKDISDPAENDDPELVLGRLILREIQAFLKDEQDWFPWQLADDRVNVNAGDRDQILKSVRSVFVVQQLARFYARTSKCQGLRLIPFAVVLLVPQLFGTDDQIDFVAALEDLLGTKAREKIKEAVEVVQFVEQWMKQEGSRLDALSIDLRVPERDGEPVGAGEGDQPRENAKFGSFFSAGKVPSSMAWDTRLKEEWLSAVRRAYRLMRRWQRREPGCRQLWETALRLAKETAGLKLRFEETLEKAKLDALAEFAAGAGHEINNPLAIISGHAQLLFRQVTHPEGRRMLATIVAQAQRAHEMITDARLFARPPKPVFSPVNYHDLLQKVVEEWSPQAELRHVRLDLNQSGRRELLEGLADPYQVPVALGAIVKNALEAAPENGIVRLQIEADEHEIRISVTDNGPGITPEVRAHLFDPFFSGRQAGRGLGLGLSKAWRIVTLHGGRIDVQSTPGKETTFCVCLPRRPRREI